MHRLRVIDRGRDALRLQRRGEGVAVGALGRRMVYCAHTEVQPRSHARHRRRGCRARARIARGDLVARRDLVVGRSSASRSGSRPAWCRAAPVRPSRTLSYLSMPWPWTRMLRSVAASSSSSVKIAPPSPKQPSGLAGKKLVAVASPKRAELAALVGGAETLRGVVEHEQALGLRDRGDRIVIGALAEQVDRDHRRPASGRAPRAVAMPRLQRGRRRC